MPEPVEMCRSERKRLAPLVSPIVTPNLGATADVGEDVEDNARRVVYFNRDDGSAFFGFVVVYGWRVETNALDGTVNPVTAITSSRDVKEAILFRAVPVDIAIAPL